MLYEIEKPPVAQNSVILLNPADNVAVARLSLPAQHDIEVNGVALRSSASIPAGHKVAIRPIAQGEAVYRYGNVIGFATRSITPGEHVHVHNLGYQEHDLSEVPPDVIAPRSSAPSSQATFQGFERSDGRVGTRNYIAVVA